MAVSNVHLFIFATRQSHPPPGSCSSCPSKPYPTLRAVEGVSTAGPSHSRKSNTKICCDAQHRWLVDNWGARFDVRALGDMCENGRIVLRSRSALYELHSNAVETPNAVR
jgi:hypothetical protein